MFSKLNAPCDSVPPLPLPPLVFPFSRFFHCCPPGSPPRPRLPLLPSITQFKPQGVQMSRHLILWPMPDRSSSTASTCLPTCADSSTAGFPSVHLSPLLLLVPGSAGHGAVQMFHRGPSALHLSAQAPRVQESLSHWKYTTRLEFLGGMARDTRAHVFVVI